MNTSDEMHLFNRKLIYFKCKTDGSAGFGQLLSTAIINSAYNFHTLFKVESLGQFPWSLAIQRGQGN